MTNQTHSSKKEKQNKDEHPQKKTLDSVRQVHKSEGQKYVLYLWKKSGRTGKPRRSFYTKVSGRHYFVFQRGECTVSMLQLQHKPRRKPMDFWEEIGRQESE